MRETKAADAEPGLRFDAYGTFLFLCNASITFAFQDKLPLGKCVLRLREGRGSSLACLPLLEQPLFADVGLFVTCADPAEAGIERLLTCWEVPMCPALHDLWYYFLSLLPEAVISCQVCGKTFKGPEWIQLRPRKDHVNTKHWKQFADRYDGELPQVWRCGPCNKDFHNLTGRHDHKQTTAHINAMKRAIADGTDTFTGKVVWISDGDQSNDSSSNRTTSSSTSRKRASSSNHPTSSSTGRQRARSSNNDFPSTWSGSAALASSNNTDTTPSSTGRRTRATVSSSIAARLQDQHDVYQEMVDRRPPPEQWEQMGRRQRRLHDGQLMASIAPVTVNLKLDSVLVPLSHDHAGSRAAAKAFRECARVGQLDVPNGCHASVPYEIDVCGSTQQLPAIQLRKYVDASPEWNAHIVPIGKQEWVSSAVSMHANFNSSEWQPVHAVEDVCRRNDAVIKGSKAVRNPPLPPFFKPFQASVCFDSGSSRLHARTLHQRSLSRTGWGCSTRRKPSEAKRRNLFTVSQ